MASFAPVDAHRFHGQIQLLICDMQVAVQSRLGIDVSKPFFLCEARF